MLKFFKIEYQYTINANFFNRVTIRHIWSTYIRHCSCGHSHCTNFTILDALFFKKNWFWDVQKNFLESSQGVSLLFTELYFLPKSEFSSHNSSFYDSVLLLGDNNGQLSIKLGWYIVEIYHSFIFIKMSFFGWNDKLLVFELIGCKCNIIWQ